MSSVPDRTAVGAAAQLRLLLGLRLRTVLRLAGRRRGLAVLLLLSALIAVGVAAFLGWAGLAGSRWLAAEQARGTVPPGSLFEWVHLCLFAVWVMLVLLPLLGFAGNEFYDITKLFHLPVRHGTVFLAETFGLMFGGTVLLFVPFLAGVVLGLPGVPAIAVLRLLLLLLLLLNAVILSQLLKLAFLNVLRSRRFRDLAAILAALLSGALFVAFRLMAEAGSVKHQILNLLGRRASRFLLPVPSSWISAAVVPEAEPSRALPLLLAFAAVTVLAVLGAVSLQRRAFFGEIPLAKAGGRPRRRTRFRVHGVGWIPGEVRAVARNELRLLRREPVVKTIMIQQCVFVLAPLAILFFMGPRRVPAESFLAPAGALLLFVESHLLLNVFGLDGAGIGQVLMTPVPRRRLLAGKLLAYGLLFGALNLLVLGLSLGAASLLGQSVPAPRVVSLAVGYVSGLLVMLGLGAAVSILVPLPLAAHGRRSLDHARSGREGCLMGVLRLFVFVCFSLLLVPVFLLLGDPLLSPLALLYGSLVLVCGLRFAMRLLEVREETLFGALARSPD
jgi:hypothetical protein